MVFTVLVQGCASNGITNQSTEEHSSVSSASLEDASTMREESGEGGTGQNPESHTGEQSDISSTSQGSIGATSDLGDETAAPQTTSTPERSSTVDDVSDVGAASEPPDSTETSGDVTGVASDQSSDSTSTSGTNSTTEPRPLRNYLPCEIETVLATRCRACHGQSGSGEEPLLDTWGEVSAESELILEVVLEDFMPLVGGPLSSEQKTALTEWVEGGAQPVRQETPPVCVP